MFSEALVVVGAWHSIALRRIALRYTILCLLYS